MDYLSYQIDNDIINVGISRQTEFFYGPDIYLSNEFDDLTKKTNWYDIGFSTYKNEKAFDFQLVHADITRIVRGLVEKQTNKRLPHFTLEKYHHFVDDEQHKEIIKKTRRLYPEELGFDETVLVNFFSEILGIPLSFFDRLQQKQHWIIVRINKPKSKGFNPVHKDVYEAYDQTGEIPRMVNAWIPICGVNSLAGLPLAPASHLINENRIQRTKSGVTVAGQRYSVNCIRSWDDRNQLFTISPQYGELLLFSSNLIHGLALNNNTDLTRISLEFRLHAK